LLESPCESGIEPPGSISHGVSYLGVTYTFIQDPVHRNMGITDDHASLLVSSVQEPLTFSLRTYYSLLEENPSAEPGIKLRPFWSVVNEVNSEPSEIKLKNVSPFRI